MPENDIDKFESMMIQTQTVEAPQEPTSDAPLTTGTQEPVDNQPVLEETTTEPKETDTKIVPEQDDTDAVLAILEGKKVETQTNEFDYSVFKDVLGKEVKSTDEIKEAITSYKEAASKYENQLSSLPPELRTAMEVAQNGGDYLTALGVAQLDYNQIPSAEFVRTMFPNTPDGEDQFKEYLDNVHPSQIEFQGAQMRNQAIQKQQAELNYIHTQTIARKQANEEAIKRELDGVETFLGNKVTPSERLKVFNSLAKGLAGEYKNPDGSIDAKRAVTEKLIIALAPTLIKNAKHKGATEAVERMVTQTSNVDLKRTTPIQQFTQPQSQKSPLESYLSELRAGAMG